MKKELFYLLSLFFGLNNSFAQQTNEIVENSFIERVLQGLASDEMRGRHAFTKDAERAAQFIAQEFKSIGLKPYNDSSYLQNFNMNKISRIEDKVVLNTQLAENNSYLLLGNNNKISWTEKSNIKIVSILKSDDFASKFRSFAQADENLIVLVDPSFTPYINRFNKIYGKDNISVNNEESYSKAFIITKSIPKSFEISYTNAIQSITMSNVVGVIPGQKEPNQYVIFSGHYDHIGILAPVDQDSIANGADDDASGITAMISLAKYYKKQNNNARTLIFAAFTGEEIGMYGSKFFSNNIHADDVVAMINIEMIGKDSKFGPNSLYITGYERSNLGELMQHNLKGSTFTFHPDPYIAQNLFYRSDNAVLAALGVPAHTFSTSQIDKDSYYHTVKDEISTLNIENIKASIEAIAIGAKGIVDGSQTPSRVEKLKD